MKNHNPERIISDIASTLKPEYRYDGKEDFALWQERSRSKLSELLGLNYMLKCEPLFEIEYTKDCGEYTKMRFTFQSEPGYYVPGYILMPKNVSAPIPATICIQGHSKGMQISIGEAKYEGDLDVLKRLDEDFGLQAVKRGSCAIVLEQRYMGECGGDEEGPGCCSGGREGTASAVKALLVGRCAIGERVWDISRLIDAVNDNFKQIDTDNLTCVGTSGGGTATFYAACIDERIKYALPACSICTYSESIINIYHCPCNYIPSIVRYFDMGDLGGLIAPRGLVIFAGETDPIFPIQGVRKTADIIKSLYRAAGAENKFRLAVDDCGHCFSPSVAYKALDEIQKNDR